MAKKHTSGSGRCLRVGNVILTVLLCSLEPEPAACWPMSCHKVERLVGCARVTCRALTRELLWQLEIRKTHRASFGGCRKRVSLKSLRRTPSFRAALYDLCYIRCSSKKWTWIYIYFQSTKQIGKMLQPNQWHNTDFSVTVLIYTYQNITILKWTSYTSPPLSA